MTRHAKTEALIEAAAAILAEHHPMTVRQVFYRLVSRQVIENTRSAYQAVSKALVAARRDGLIPWEPIEDRFRQPRAVAMFAGIGLNFTVETRSKTGEPEPVLREKFTVIYRIASSGPRAGRSQSGAGGVSGAAGIGAEGLRVEIRSTLLLRSCHANILANVRPRVSLSMARIRR
jgi:hypothetical protein